MCGLPPYSISILTACSLRRTCVCLHVNRTRLSHSAPLHRNQRNWTASLGLNRNLDWAQQQCECFCVNWRFEIDCITVFVVIIDGILVAMMQHLDFRFNPSRVPTYYCSSVPCWASHLSIRLKAPWAQKAVYKCMLLFREPNYRPIFYAGILCSCIHLIISNNNCKIFYSYFVLKFLLFPDIWRFSIS